LPKELPPPDGRAHRPGCAPGHRLPAAGGLGDQEPVAELWIVEVGVEDRVGQVGLPQVASVTGLASHR
jgi:hypothetical protein